MILFCVVLMLALKFLFFPFMVNPVMDYLGSKSVELYELTGSYSNFYAENSWMVVSAFSLAIVINIHLAMKK